MARFTASWREVGFDEAFQRLKLKAFEIPTKDYQVSGTYPIIDQGDGAVAGYIDREDPISDVPFIVFGDHTTIVKYVDQPCFIGSQGVVPLKARECYDPYFLYLMLGRTRIPALGYSRHFRELENKTFPLPPLPEQRKIAEILRTWDEAIETAEAELKAKQERKRWIMDQLFKFAPESQMEILQMREALDIQKGEQLNRHTLSDEGRYPVWNGGVTPSGYTELHNTEGPAVIMSEGGNSCGTVTYVRGNFWRGGHCYQVVPNTGFTNDYLFAALKYYEAQIMRLRVGSGLPNIQKKTFLSWSVPLHVPAFREKVAAIFSQAQLESELAIGRIESLRTQKRGLMQKLLTGEVRVAA